MTRLSIAIPCALFVAAGAFAPATASGQTTPPPATTGAQNPPAKPPALPTTPAPIQAPKAMPFATDSKVGFVNMQVVVGLSELGKKGGVTLNDFKTRKSAELTAKGKEIDDLQKDIDAGRTVLSPTVLQTKGLDLERKKRELDLIQQNADAEFTAMNEQLLTSFSEKSMPIVKALAEEKGLYAIFTEQSQVVYISPAIDLTAEVIKRLDAAFPKDKDAKK